MHDDAIYLKRESGDAVVCSSNRTNGSFSRDFQRRIFENYVLNVIFGIDPQIEQKSSAEGLFFFCSCQFTPAGIDPQIK